MAKWKGTSLGAALALSLGSLAAVAQDRSVTNRQDRGDTVKINVSGRLAMDYVWRSDAMTAISDSAAAAPGAGDHSDSENTIEGEFGIRFDVDLTEKVSVQIEIGRSRIDSDGTGLNEFDGLTASGIILREANLMIQEVFSPAMKAQLGISTWNFDVRGKGNAFAFDPRHSQSFTRAWGRNQDALDDPTTGANENSFDGRGGAPGEMYPAGLVLTYAREAVQLDFVLLPVISELGNPSQDESMYAIDFWYNLDSWGKGSRIGLIAAVNSFGETVTADMDDETHVLTVGGGATLKLGQVELFGEAYFQASKGGQFVDSNGSTKEVSARGKAGQAGIVYAFKDNPNNIWIGAKVTYVSGDEDEEADNSKINRFLSYENVRDTLIMEDQYYGFDVDVNYTALKAMGGVSFSVGAGKNNLEFEVIAAVFQATEDYVRSTDLEKEGDLGNEFDVKMTYHVSKQVKLLVQGGYLTGSDILKDATGGETSNDSDSKAYLLTAGFDVQF
jgi:hypothetical protein